MITPLLYLRITHYLSEYCRVENVPPCSCSPKVISCSKADNINILYSSLLKIRSHKLDGLYIYDSDLEWIPQDFFLTKLPFQSVTLTNVNLNSLSETSTAFHGLEEILTALMLKSVTITNGLEWSQLRNLKYLQQLIVINVKLQKIDDQIKSIEHMYLERLLLKQAEISTISDEAFSNFEYLVSLSMESNLITTLKKSMFPKSPNRFKEFDFSYNKLSTLPSDLFSDMPKLQTLILAGNAFTTLSEASFAPVWEQLKKLDVLDNPLRCDCRMKWILDKKFPINTWGECAQPSKITGTELTNLKSVDLWC